MAFFPHHHLQPQQSQQPTTFRNFVPIDGQITAPIALFNTVNYPDQSQPPFLDAMGLAPGAVPAVGDAGSNGWEAGRRRPKEQELLENSQISSIDFLQTAGSVSTGLALSLDDRPLAASSWESPLLSMVDDDISREVQRMDAEMDRFIKTQSEGLRQSILEKFQAKQFQALASVEDNILRKIQAKAAETEAINKRNSELEEQIRQMTMEASAWQQRAKYNESVISALKHNLEQVYTRQRGDNREGCGESEVVDTSSCCNGSGPNLQLLPKANKKMAESTTCRVCKANEACMLLLPCRHLCLCKECESKTSSCPRCQSSKILGMEIYML